MDASKSASDTGKSSNTGIGGDTATPVFWVRRIYPSTTTRSGAVSGPSASAMTGSGALSGPSAGVDGSADFRSKLRFGGIAMLSFSLSLNATVPIKINTPTHQDECVEPGSGSQDLAARIWKPGSGSEDLEVRMWQP